MSGIENAAQVVQQVQDSGMLEEGEQVEMESMADSSLSFSWNKPEKPDDIEKPASTTPRQGTIEKIAASMVKLAGPLTTSAVKNTHIEERLMRNHIKLHETVRQISILVEASKDSRADPSWMGAKLLHELQDFLEVDRLRMGLRGLSFEIRQQLEIEKMKLILLIVLLSAEEDPASFPTQKVVYFKQVETAYVQVLVPGETFEQVALKVHQLEQNPIPFYNTQRLRTWSWSTSEGRYFPGWA